MEKHDFSEVFQVEAICK